MRENFIGGCIIILIMIYCSIKGCQCYTARNMSKGRKSKKYTKKKNSNVIKLKHKHKKNDGKFIHNVKSKKLGRDGENKVKRELKKLPSSYMILNDLMVRTSRTTNQIDHVVLSSKGIFVIETKNFEGSIYGKENDRYWTQYLPGSKEKNKFYNPILQNKGHMGAIKYKLNNSIDCDIISIVCFDEKADLKNVNSDTAVLYIGQVSRFIKNYKPSKKITKNMIQEAVSILKSANVTGIGERMSHARSVQKRQEKK